MNEYLERVFKLELRRQSGFAATALEDLNQALATNDMTRIWYSVQALLISVGNISKVLWPPNSKYEGRGAALRASLGVREQSPLAPRSFRNHFEHFDERLEAWAASSERHNLADSNVGPEGMISGLDPGDFLRNLDAEAMEVTFRGDRYSLKPIVEALSSLQIQLPEDGLAV